MAAVDELERFGIERRFMHCLAGSGNDLGNLPVASEQQKLDVAARLERFLWGGNLALFFTALFVLLAMLMMGVEWYWLLLPAGLMLVSLVMGLEFATKSPCMHMKEFDDALQHHEILLMVDVPLWRSVQVEHLVRRHHPEAVSGGVGWCTEDTLRI